jgi:hypothetical protein
VGPCFQNAQPVASLSVMFIELGRKQQATPLRTKKSSAYGILNETIKQKKVKIHGHEVILATRQIPPKTI